MNLVKCILRIYYSQASYFEDTTYLCDSGKCKSFAYGNVVNREFQTGISSHVFMTFLNGETLRHLVRWKHIITTMTLLNVSSYVSVIVGWLHHIITKSWETHHENLLTIMSWLTYYNKLCWALTNVLMILLNCNTVRRSMTSWAKH